MAIKAETPSSGVIRSLIPARIDRLPWSRFHTRLVSALGVAWILDGLEITIASNVGPDLTLRNTLNMSASGVADIVDMIGSDKMFLFASDYPHWQFDGDDAIPPHLPDNIVARMCEDNPLETFPRLKLAA